MRVRPTAYSGIEWRKFRGKEKRQSDKKLERGRDQNQCRRLQRVNTLFWVWNVKEVESSLGRNEEGTLRGGEKKSVRRPQGGNRENNSFLIRK